MLALQLAMASLQVRWKVWRYEISRWILVASMLFFSVHYLLQMLHGLRAQGTDVGAAFNILFYTPVAFAITLSIINIESTGNKVRRYCLRSMMAYILIAIVFVIGMFKNNSLHIGNMLYVDAENHPMAEPDFTGFTDTVRTVDEVWEHYFALDNRKVYYVVVWNKLYKRAMFDTLRFRDGKRYEDQFFMLDVLRRFGADVRETQDAVTVRRCALRGVTIDAAPIPDLIPVLSVVAALADGQTQIVNAARLRLKESDRLESTAAMLRALGAQVEVHDSGLTVTGRKVLTGGTVDPQHDHRIAMAAAVAACACAEPVTIEGWECTNKSYPRFGEDFNALKREETP